MGGNYVISTSDEVEWMYEPSEPSVLLSKGPFELVRWRDSDLLKTLRSSGVYVDTHKSLVPRWATWVSVHSKYSWKTTRLALKKMARSNAGIMALEVTERLSGPYAAIQEFESWVDQNIIDKR